MSVRPASRPVAGAATVRVRHGWPRRLWRSVQFGWARLASADGLVVAQAAPFDLAFTGPAADCITRHIYRWGAHEPHITSYLLEQVRVAAGEVALDVGANLGWYSVLLDRLSEPGAAIFAFEPDPESHRLLCANLQANRATHVTALNVALGDRVGTATLHRYKASNNGRHTLLDGNSSGGLVDVPLDTLERFWGAAGLDGRRIRLLKVDVEGYELFVLRGAGSLLARCDCVLLEYSPESLAVAGLAADALVRLLAQTGLGLRAFVNGVLEPMSWEALLEARVQHDLVLTR